MLYRLGGNRRLTVGAAPLDSGATVTTDGETTARPPRPANKRAPASKIVGNRYARERPAVGVRASCMVSQNGTVVTVTSTRQRVWQVLSKDNTV
jgi:hypothetical protein